ncbi:major capsid protein [Chromobacterium haemolyticum]|nr:major capsid protein [Chromobacterium haemolyticum]
MKHLNQFRRFALPALLAAAAVPAFAAADGSIDTSTITTLLAGGVVAVAAIGAAVMGVNGAIKLWGFVKSALART